MSYEEPTSKSNNETQESSPDNQGLAPLLPSKPKPSSHRERSSKRMESVTNTPLKGKSKRQEFLSEGKTPEEVERILMLAMNEDCKVKFEKICNMIDRMKSSRDMKSLLKDINMGKLKGRFSIFLLDYVFTSARKKPELILEMLFKRLTEDGNVSQNLELIRLIDKLSVTKSSSSEEKSNAVNALRGIETEVKQHLMLMKELEELDNQQQQQQKNEGNDTSKSNDSANSPTPSAPPAQEVKYNLYDEVPKLYVADLALYEGYVPNNDNAPLPPQTNPYLYQGINEEVGAMVITGNGSNDIVCQKCNRVIITTKQPMIKLSCGDSYHLACMKGLPVMKNSDGEDFVLCHRCDASMIDALRTQQRNEEREQQEHQERLQEQQQQQSQQYYYPVQEKQVHGEEEVESKTLAYSEVVEKIDEGFMIDHGNNKELTRALEDKYGKQGMESYFTSIVNKASPYLWRSSSPINSGYEKSHDTGEQFLKVNEEMKSRYRLGIKEKIAIFPIMMNPLKIRDEELSGHFLDTNGITMSHLMNAYITPFHLKYTFGLTTWADLIKLNLKFEHIVKPSIRANLCSFMLFYPHKVEELTRLTDFHVRDLSSYRLSPEELMNMGLLFRELLVCGIEPEHIEDLQLTEVDCISTLMMTREEFLAFATNFPDWRHVMDWDQSILIQKFGIIKSEYADFGIKMEKKKKKPVTKQVQAIHKKKIQPEAEPENRYTVIQEKVQEERVNVQKNEFEKLAKKQLEEMMMKKKQPKKKG
jgi:hypothetical protein